MYNRPTSLVKKIGVLFIATTIILSLGAAPPVTAQTEIDTSKLEIGEITAVSEVETGEEIDFTSGAEIRELPADWSAQLEFQLYVDGERVTTQNASLEDGDSIDVVIPHEFEQAGEKEVYIQVEGEIEREGRFATQTAAVKRTTQTITINATPNTTEVDGAVFTAPDSLKEDIEELRDQVPGDAGRQSFVLASDNELYIVLSDEKQQEGYASVEGFSPDVDRIEQGEIDFGVIVATDVESQQPSTESVDEVYNNPDDYSTEYVEFEAHHRNIAIDYEEGPFSTSVGVLVDEPLETDDLFSSVGGQSYSVLDDTNEGNVGGILGGLSQPRIVTTSFETEYWGNSEATVDGIVAPSESPARDFIEKFQEDEVIPTDGNAPVLYVINEEQNSQRVSGVSELSDDIRAYEGETVSLETNLFMNTISSKRIIQSATGTPLPPVDVILHGGVAWDRLPEDRDDLVMIMGASSTEQNTTYDTEKGEYEITGEVVSTDRIEGDLPDGYILIAYEIERAGDLNTATPGDLIEQQSSSISGVLEQQANPEIDASAVTGEDGGDEQEQTTEDGASEQEQTAEDDSEEQDTQAAEDGSGEQDQTAEDSTEEQEGQQVSDSDADSRTSNSDTSDSNTNESSPLGVAVFLIAGIGAVGGIGVSGIGVILVPVAAIGKVVDSQHFNISFKKAFLVIGIGVSLLVVSGAVILLTPIL